MLFYLKYIKMNVIGSSSFKQPMAHGTGFMEKSER